MRLLPITLLFIYFGLSTNLEGQEDFGVLYWTAERDLTWNDFKGKSLVDSSDNFFLDIYVESLSVYNSDYYYIRNSKSDVYIFTNTSYADEEVKNEDLLRYFNVYFDLAAVYTEKLERLLVKARTSEDEFYMSNPSVIKNAVIEEWRVESSRFVLETHYGEEIESLLIWEKDVNEKVAKIVEPIFTLSDYSFALDFTVGPLIGLNEYKQYLTQPVAFVLGVEVAKAPFTYNFGISGGGQTVKKSFSKGNDEFPIDTEPNMLNIFMHTGYQLLKSEYLNITPRAGIHFSNLRYPDDEDINSSAWSISYTGGLIADIKLSKWDYSNWRDATISNFGLRIGAYYYPIKLGGQNLSHVLVTAGIFWSMSGVDINYP